MWKTMVGLGATVLLVACTPDLGDCDETAAREVVYAVDGTPAYAGQALVISSCGGGGFCHATGAEGEARFGAPAGLDFDLRLASTSASAATSELARLNADQLRAYAHRHHMWLQVSGGHMPPGGDAGQRVAASAQQFERASEDGLEFTPLADLRDEANHVTFRNWLACGLPVIERTIPRGDGQPVEVGDLVASCVRGCVYPSWNEIYRSILRPNCATSGCHGGDSLSAGFDLGVPGDDLVVDPSGELLTSAEVDDVLARIRGRAPTGALCRADGAPMLVDGSPEGSLLYQKVSVETSDEVCGSIMPLVGNRLSNQELCALEVFVTCLGCEGAACDTCVENQLDLPENAECNVRLEGGEGRCVDEQPCLPFPASG